FRIVWHIVDREVGIWCRDVRDGDEGSHLLGVEQNVLYLVERFFVALHLKMKVMVLFLDAADVGAEVHVPFVDIGNEREREHESVEPECRAGPCSTMQLTVPGHNAVAYADDLRVAVR